VPSNPTALHTAGYTDPDVSTENEALSGDTLGQNGMEFNDSSGILNSEQGTFSSGQM
jgi:hypothetical protein